MTRWVYHDATLITQSENIATHVANAIWFQSILGKLFAPYSFLGLAVEVSKHSIRWKDVALLAVDKDSVCDFAKVLN